jgi:hypothetical protein
MSIQNQTPSEQKHPFNAANYPTQFTFYEDARHGWLQVPYSMLVALGIQDKITGYSYQKGNMVYLEEDLDAVTFWNAYLEAIGRPKDYKYGNSLVYTEYSHSSSIRNYEHYTGNKK